MRQRLFHEVRGKRHHDIEVWHAIDFDASQTIHHTFFGIHALTPD
jgi:hypothetical protein